MKKFTYLITTLLSFQLFSQSVPDISFTDIDGNSYNLYETLDEGKTVVLDFFFVNCIPCQYYTPVIDSLNMKWGNGNTDVVFWAFSDIDDNSEVESFREEFNVSYILTGIEGGGPEVISSFAEEFTFSGYPTYSVICPDKTITWNIWPISEDGVEIDAAINACGASLPTSAMSGPDQEILIGCIHPNPAQDKIEISLAESLKGINTIRISTLEGQVIKSVKSDLQKLQLEVSDMHKGVYVLTVFTIEGKQSSQKLIIQ